MDLSIGHGVRYRAVGSAGSTRAAADIDIGGPRKKHMNDDPFCCAALADSGPGVGRAGSGGRGLRQVEQYNFSIHVLACCWWGSAF